MGENTRTGPVCAQRATRYNSRVPTLSNPELNKAKEGELRRPNPSRGTPPAHLSVIETSRVDLDEYLARLEGRKGLFHDSHIIIQGLAQKLGLIL